MSKLHTLPEQFTGDLPGMSLRPGQVVERRFTDEPDAPCCFRVSGRPAGAHVELSYFVGVDWVHKGEHALYVEPKLDGTTGPRTDYLSMLLAALRHPDLLGCTRDLFVIDFESPTITIAQQQDLLTPLLVVQFLSVVRRIARKGLKKSYYRVEEKYAATIKGKILVAKTLKHHLTRHRQTDVICAHEEFGFDGWENRLLKSALRLVQRYLPALGLTNAFGWVQQVFTEVLPAFDRVAEEASSPAIRPPPANVFFREYDEGLRLARLILRRFGYQPNRAHPEAEVHTPPFWIDMSKLFELHVLGLLKDAYGPAVVFQAPGHGVYPDFLLCAEGTRMIIDAKYKQVYANEHGTAYRIEDIRQLSGYGRDRKLLKRLGYAPAEWPGTVVDCLIVYPAAHSASQLPTTAIDLAWKTPIKEFERFFKLSVALPTTG